MNTKKIGFGIPQKDLKLFELAIDKFGIWPLTVWECNYSDKHLKILKSAIGDMANEHNHTSTRSGSLHSENIFDTINYYKVSASTFNPIIAIWIYNLYAPKDAIIYDPFAGGGTRAIIAAKKGLKYIGVELRKKEVDEINEKLKQNGVEDSVHIIHGDSQSMPIIKDCSCNFSLTCPPYYNLEKYDGGENDLSMVDSYEDFLDGIKKCIEESYRILRPGSFSCWVIGLYRDGEILLPLHHDIARLHNQIGFDLKEEIILYWKNTGNIRRVGNFSKGRNLLVRTHEYCLVFVR